MEHPGWRKPAFWTVFSTGACKGSIRGYTGNRPMSKIGSGVHGTKKRGKVIGQPKIVMPEVGNELTSGLPKAFIVWCSLMTKIFRQIDPSDPGVAMRGLCHNRFRIVRAPIPNDKEFKIRHRLPKHTANRERENAAPIPRGDNDRYTWRPGRFTAYWLHRM